MNTHLEPPPFIRHPANPIIRPGGPAWRRATVFNPGVLHEDGRFFLYERAAGSLRPFICSIGLLESDDGVRFRRVGEEPVFTPEMAGSVHGSVQDPRVVRIDGRYWMTFAFRPYAWSSHPTGIGVPESHETEFPGVERAPVEAGRGGSANVKGARPDNMTRSGLAVSDDRLTWRFHSWITPPEIDDRDVILFPEKIGGRFCVLRRPLHLVGPGHGTTGPSIWMSWSDDLERWTDPGLLAAPCFDWEDNRIGGSTTPIRTAEGWLVLYHGVQEENPSIRHVIYRVGALLLDSDDPAKVIARTPVPLMEPEHYYERFGLYIPDVIFPTGNVVVDGLLHVYYGVCDTAIALATVPLEDLVHYLVRHCRV